jgi:AmpD protein
VTKAWLPGVERKLSPFCSPRPQAYGEGVDLVVIHNITLPPGEFGKPYIEQMFLGELDVNAHPYFATINARVSPHLLINREGKLIQFVSFYEQAWHAGVSSFQGREKCNEFSIGIELEGTDFEPFTAAQYQRLREVLALLQQFFPGITADRIVGHSDVAPGRKTDPGPFFDWSKIR